MATLRLNLLPLVLLLTWLTPVLCGRPGADPQFPGSIVQTAVPERKEEGGATREKLVCWRSTDHGGYASTQISGQGIPGVAVIGPGCSRCVAGATCSFTISIASPANWLAPASESQRRELNVEMVGPATHSVLLSPATLDDSSFLATYRTWDAGVYRVSIRSSCGTLNYSSGPETQMPHEMATWQLEVVRPAEEVDGRVLLAPMEEGAPVSASAGVEWALTLPCARGQYGRWLQTRNEGVKWTPYECAGFAELKPEQWPAALNKRGIYEINFVGDSHQRMLMLHLRFLMTGELDMAYTAVHKSFFHEVRGSEGGRLRLNMEWMGGIYRAGTEVGCSNQARGRKEPVYPENVSPADAWIVDAGYWTGMYCNQPESALASYLPHFLLWAKDQVRNSTLDPNRLRREGARKEAIFAYRPTPPRDTEERGCKNLFTNKYVRAANTIERALAPHFGAVLFDSWETEAARFRDHCLKDHHFSCAVEVEAKSGQFHMGGAVGEADVIALIYFLLNQ